MTERDRNAIKGLLFVSSLVTGIVLLGLQEFLGGLLSLAMALFIALRTWQKRDDPLPPAAGWAAFLTFLFIAGVVLVVSNLIYMPLTARLAIFAGVLLVAPLTAFFATR